jgi:hypothetical protein
MMFEEWCDSWDGSNITRFAAWMQAHNVVAHSYWNNDSDFIPHGLTCSLDAVSSRHTAFFNGFANTHYTGTYFTLKPMPPPPNGF